MVQTLVTVLPNVEVVLLPSGNYAIRTDLSRVVSRMEFWSEIVEEVQLTATAQDLAITGGNVVVAIPDGATVVRAVTCFKFGAIENTNVGANEIEATAQDIEVKELTAGTFIDAIDITQGAFKLAASTREGGDIIIGDIDVKAEVDANGTYAFQWKAAEAILGNLQFNNVQMGLLVYFMT